LLVLGKDAVREREMIYAAQEEFKTKSFSNCLVDISQNVQVPQEVKSCTYSKAILSFGDSHSRDVYQALVKAHDQLNNNLLILSAHKGGCRIIENKPHCIDHYERVLKFINDTTIPIDSIVYTQAARTLIGIDGRANLSMAKKLLDSLDHFANERVSVLWLGPRASIGISRKEAARLCFLEEKSVAQIEIKDKLFESTKLGVKVDYELKNGFEFSKYGVDYISQVEILGHESQRISSVTDCNYLYWSNEDHLSQYGEKKFGTKFVSFFNGL
jgi:hypothetical protein